MKKYVLPLAFLSLLSLQQSAFGQAVYDDIRKISIDEVNGTARFRALGGVNTALGGDISSISGNPAGIGFFSQSDVSITFNVMNNNNKSTYFGNSLKSNDAKFGIDNAGIVLHFPTAYDDNYGWQNLNIGLSINRQSNFSNSISYRGINDQNSVVHFLTDEMYRSGAFESDFSKSYLVEKFQTANAGYFPTVLEADPKGQQVNINYGGYKYMSNFSVGANYSHKMYFGAAIGLLSYKNTIDRDVNERGWTKQGDEIAADNPNTLFNKPGTIQNAYTDINYALTDRNLTTSTGYGANVTLGMMLKPTWDWNIGLSFTSPTWTTVKYDDYLDTEAKYYANETSTTEIHPKYVSLPGGRSRDYSVVSPWKTAVGLTKFFGRGLLSADAEYVGYNSIQYIDEDPNADLSEESSIKQDIIDIYKGTFNFRVGAEYVITDRFTGRAGFNYMGSPYRDNTTKGSTIGSLGLGYIFPNAMYIDVTAMQFQSKTSYNLAYELDPVWKSPEPEAEIKTSRTNVMLTLGMKF